jgi:Flp pilus assembly protein TadB
MLVLTGLTLLVQGFGAPTAQRATAAMGGWHDAIAQRTRQRLATAGCALTPTSWRSRQAGGAGATILACTAAGIPVTVSASAAVLLTRLVSSLILWRGRRRRRADLDAAIVPLARRLATELARGCSLTAAIPAAATATHAGGQKTAASSILNAASRRIELGAPPIAALERSAVACWGAVPPAMRAVLETARLAEDAGGPGGAWLQALADRLESVAQLRRQARATVTEARVVAVAVPALALLCATAISVADPAVVVAALTPLGMSATAVAAAVAVIGVTLVFRLTSVA